LFLVLPYSNTILTSENTKLRVPQGLTLGI